MEEFIRGLPKSELHVHIEGTLEPELMFELAERNGIRLSYGSVAEVRAAFEFEDLQSFLDIYYEAAGVLQTEDDFADLMAAYFDRVAGDGVRHAEVFFDPQTHTERGIGFDVFMPGFARAQEAAARRHGISSQLIMCFVRHLPPTAALETWQQAQPYLDQLVGVGLDSSEIDHPPGDFQEVYARAAIAGLRRVAHAGEEGPPEYVTEALDVLGVERLDHGIKSIEDSGLMDRLAAERIPLTMCPLSNVKLRAVDQLADHPLKRFMDTGVVVTINSDDPSYFGGYIGDNYIETAAALGLTRDEVVEIARNSFRASFLPEDEKERWLAEVDEYVASH
jgi:adenosine deaminase